MTVTKLLRLLVLLLLLQLMKWDLKLVLLLEVVLVVVALVVVVVVVVQEFLLHLLRLGVRHLMLNLDVVWHIRLLYHLPCRNFIVQF
mmetsp:Transcript_12789/g.19935  ORF Transcript_12789/g.19935 Transcript_12789/m.19935 type:complete len:87 (+) Transcript_12789:160-420(+)